MTKIRTLKKKMLVASLEAVRTGGALTTRCSRLIAQDLELSTVALAYVYFEKLLLKAVITKVNRKLLAATCLLYVTCIHLCMW